ncbi:28S ribosomal protein S6 [Mactra antiquata]
MPSYEVALIIRSALERTQMKNVLKGACQSIFHNGGVVKKMENLGYRELPHPMKSHTQKFTHGNYFCIQFNSSTDAMAKISKSYNDYDDVLRHGIVKNEVEPRRPCLDGPCQFGELKNPDHDRAAYTRRVLQRYKNKHFRNL